MRQIEKNTVPAKDQLKDGSILKFDGDGTGLRILFVGNSITMHGCREEIWWYGDNYGMAASCEENDYVHLTAADIRRWLPDASWGIAQVAEWESRYKDGRCFFDRIEQARDFAADVIIMRCIENCPETGYDKDIFMREYEALIDYLRADESAQVILTTSFWHHVADEAIREVGARRGYTVIELGDLGEDDEMKAVGKFRHKGVANHPGDKGMRAIADRILGAIDI